MTLKNCTLDDDAVSPVVGELLMIVLAILLVSLFSVALLGLLPSDRSDSVDILMDNSQDDITLYHKGGDWVKKSDLQVVIIKDKKTTIIRSSDDSFTLEGNSFDLGDKIVITVQPPMDPIEGGEIVRLVSGRSVIFSGKIRDP